MFEMFKKKNPREMSDSEFAAAQARKEAAEKGVAAPTPSRVMGPDGVVLGADKPVETQVKEVREAHQEWKEAA